MNIKTEILKQKSYNFFGYRFAVFSVSELSYYVIEIIYK